MSSKQEMIAKLDTHLAAVSEATDALREELGSFTNLGGFECWVDHPIYDREFWRSEVSENNTNLGYWSWVASMVIQGADDESES